MFEERDGRVADGSLGVDRSTGASKVAYENPWQRVMQTSLTVDGQRRELFTTDYGERAAVVVVRDGEVLLTRQYRYLIDRISWEIPGGRVDPGEPPEVAAARECAEETGVRCPSLQPLIFFHPGLDTLHNPTHLFVCEDSEGDPAPGHETLAAAWVPVDQALRWASDGTIVDSLSIIGLLAYTARMRA